jgi:outer membrane protein assembly factor BamE (lipoprotein component of BamABCDE complex)
MLETPLLIREHIIMHRALWLLVAFVTLTLSGGCAQYDNQRGVDVSWQASVTDTLVKGQSTRQDVLTKLGPPSQIIALQDETALYYLFEHAEGNGLILVVYNRFDTQTRYDRAVFFFDENDVLSDYATHIRQ